MIRSMIRRGLLFALLWWALAEGRNDGWLLGAVAVLAATWASLRLMPPAQPEPRLRGLPGFLAFFLWNSVQGGLQVALQALRGRDALQPGVVELHLRLPPGNPRILMTAVLGLLPGTLGVELADDGLRVHVLDARLPVVAEANTLERRIALLYGVEP